MKVSIRFCEDVHNRILLQALNYALELRGTACNGGAADPELPRVRFGRENTISFSYKVPGYPDQTLIAQFVLKKGLQEFTGIDFDASYSGVVFIAPVQSNDLEGILKHFFEALGDQVREYAVAL